MTPQHITAPSIPEIFNLIDLIEMGDHGLSQIAAMPHEGAFWFHAKKACFGSIDAAVLIHNTLNPGMLWKSTTLGMFEVVDYRNPAVSNPLRLGCNDGSSLLLATLWAFVNNQALQEASAA